MKLALDMVSRLVCLLSLMGISLYAATADEFIPPKGFRAIFDGRDLAGWYGSDPHKNGKLSGEELLKSLSEQRDDFSKHWRVENGELINSGSGPYATSEEEFGDFEFRLEYKTVAGADSGVYLRGIHQVQIWDCTQAFDPAKPDRRPHLGSGGLFNNAPNTLGRDPIMKMDRPFGKWNSLRIRQIGSRTWVTLNSKLVVDGAVFANYFERDQALPKKGPVMLQTHGGEIRWRNLCVRDIGEVEAAAFLQENPPIPEPTHYDVSYGNHPKQVMHFWQAESVDPAPLLLYIHGGGWSGGGRLGGIPKMLPRLIGEGISVASIDYRFLTEAIDDGEVPPVKGPMHDAARALQFVRAKAGEWKIDKQRIAASGGSAGACTSLWLAFHDDLADPGSDDPVARESTRLLFAAVNQAQTTLDPEQMREWTPNSRYGGHAFGFIGDSAAGLSSFDQFLAKRDEIRTWINEYSPYALLSADDPPVYLAYTSPPALGMDQEDHTHTSNFGVKLKERCEALGVACELVYPGAESIRWNTVEEYLVEKLKARGTE